MSVVLTKAPANKVLTIHLTGKLQKKDYSEFLPGVEEAIKEFGKVRILVDMHDFHGWSLGAIWEDLKFDVKHFRHIERLAMVGEKKWEKWMATFCRPFTSAEIRYFGQDQMEEARIWIELD